MPSSLTGTLEGNSSAAWTYCCPKRIKKAEGHGKEEVSLDPYMVWKLNRDLLGSREYEAENHWGLQHQTELLRGGQIGREGQKALTAEKDKTTTNSSTLEANSGRMPTGGTGPTIPREFQLVHTQEPVLGQGPLPSDIKMPHKPSCLHLDATLERSKGRMLRILECSEFEILSLYFKEKK